MNQGKYVFAQVMSFASRHEFKKCVERYGGNYRVKTFDCWQQFLLMAFGQLTYRHSLRDIVTCLNAQSGKLYNLGFRSKIALSTLADANERRNWRIYADFAACLVSQARELYRDSNSISSEIDRLVYSIDSSTIGLCLSVFPWAKYRSMNAGIKLHTQLDLRGNIPSFIHITTARVHDVNFLDRVHFEIDAVYVMDKAYADLKRLFMIHKARAFFVVRPRENMKFRRLYSLPKSKEHGIKYDQIVKLRYFKSNKKYPEKVRCIKFWDQEKNRHFRFLTNITDLPAEQIAELYKNRWHVELFFKWIKQHLRIEKLWGHSQNAVKTQIWIAICTYLLVAIVKKRLKSELSPYKILQILSISSLDKTPLNQLLTNSGSGMDDIAPDNQLILF